MFSHCSIYAVSPRVDYYQPPCRNILSKNMTATLTKTQLILPETEQVAEKIAALKLTGSPAPLTLGNSLDKLTKSDLTPLIGTEFARGVQIRDLLKAPNADDILKDLAILGT